jgi:hypothetical protein
MSGNAIDDDEWKQTKVYTVKTGKCVYVYIGPYLTMFDGDILKVIVV